MRNLSDNLFFFSLWVFQRLSKLQVLSSCNMSKEFLFVLSFWFLFIFYALPANALRTSYKFPVGPAYTMHISLIKTYYLLFWISASSLCFLFTSHNQWVNWLQRAFSTILYYILMTLSLTVHEQLLTMNIYCCKQTFRKKSN